MSVQAIDERRLLRDLDLPITVDDTLTPTSTGDLPGSAGRSNLRQAVRRRVLTSPGTLLWRPEYGGGLVDVVEAAATPGARAGLANAIRRNLLRDPRLSGATARVTLGVPGQASRAASVTVDLSITLRHDRSNQDLTLSVAE